jgi:hypothetical protein
MSMATPCRYQASARTTAQSRNGNGTFTITPAANYNGSVGLIYTVIDGHGGSVAASQTFNLAAINDAPFDIDLRANNAIATDMNAKGATVGTLVASDPDSTAFSFSIVSDITASFAISEAHSISRAARI